MPIAPVHETIMDRGIPKQDLNAFREAEMEVALAIRWFLVFPGNLCA
jgi:hypothetical protein